MHFPAGKGEKVIQNSRHWGLFSRPNSCFSNLGQFGQKLDIAEPFLLKKIIKKSSSQLPRVNTMENHGDFGLYTGLRFNFDNFGLFGAIINEY